MKRSNAPLVLGVLGLLSMLFGLLESSFRGETTTMSSVALIGGLTVLAAGAYLGRETLRELIVHRSSLYDMNNVLLVGTVLLVLLFVNLFAHRYSERIWLLPKYDLTRNQFFTLSPQSRQVLAGLTQPVEAIAFFITPRGAGKAEKAIQRERAQLEMLLGLYRGASPHFSFKLVDPEKEPSLAEKYGVSLPGTVVLERGDKRLVVERWSIFRPGDPVRNKQAEFTGEQALTNALLRLIDAEMPTVYFTVGHKEHNLNDSGPSGLTDLVARIQRDHYRLMQLNILTARHIPADCSCLVICGPEQDFTSEEEAVVAKYLERGGNAIFLLDTGTPLSFGRLLKPFGIRVFRNVVIDPVRSFFNRPTWPIPELQQHVITEELIRYGRVPTFPHAAALRKIYGHDTYVIRTIAVSSRQSWAETNFADRQLTYDENIDEKGPLMLAFALTSAMGASVDSSHDRQQKEFRLVTVGDADFVTNRAVSMQANADFFLNALAWVTGVADRITIRPKEFTGEKIPLTETYGEAVFYSCTVALPSLVALVGGLVWWRRRNR